MELITSALLNCSCSIGLFLSKSYMNIFTQYFYTKEHRMLYCHTLVSVYNLLNT